jgi:hypothetical protein
VVLNSYAVIRMVWFAWLRLTRLTAKKVWFEASQTTGSTGLGSD